MHPTIRRPGSRIGRGAGTWQPAGRVPVPGCYSDALDLINSATSGASPILEGAVALLLQMKPTLTDSQIRSYLYQSAIVDSFTGAVPNQSWGLGKLNVLGALDLVAKTFNTNPILLANALTFPATPNGTTGAVRTVTFSRRHHLHASGAFPLPVDSACAGGAFPKCSTAGSVTL